MSRPPVSDGTFDVVFVCTGNRARSPMAEALFRRYAPTAVARASSVGTLELGGLPALPHAVEVGRYLDVDLSGHRTRSLRDVDLGSADLVLGFEPIHVSVAIDDSGARPERTFLLGELIALLDSPTGESDVVARARAAVARAAARRPRSERASTSVAISDPLGKPASVMWETALEIDRLVRRLVQGLFGDGHDGMSAGVDHSPRAVMPLSRTTP